MRALSDGAGRLVSAVEVDITRTVALRAPKKEEQASRLRDGCEGRQQICLKIVSVVKHAQSVLP